MLGDTGDSTFKKPQVDVLLSDIAEEEANVLSDRGYKSKRIASERSLKKTTQSKDFYGNIIESQKQSTVLQGRYLVPQSNSMPRNDLPLT